MENELEFTSKPATSREQSERLVALGLKKESADMHWRMYRTFEGGEIWNCYAYKPVRWGVNNMLPAWGLYRLFEMVQGVCSRITMVDSWVSIENRFMPFIDYRCDKFDNVYDNLIDCIEWLIQEGCFPKEYLEER